MKAVGIFEISDNGIEQPSVTTTITMTEDSATGREVSFNHLREWDLHDLQYAISDRIRKIEEGK